MQWSFVHSLRRLAMSTIIRLSSSSDRTSLEHRPDRIANHARFDSSDCSAHARKTHRLDDARLLFLTIAGHCFTSKKEVPH